MPYAGASRLPGEKMTVRLLLFGSPAVEYGGESCALTFERRHQLLAFLALKKAWVGRAELAAMFWPEQQSKLAYTNLRKTLHRLQSLPWAAGLESQSGALRFEAETDVSAFEFALREHRLADALPMRRGELLAGFNDDQSEAWSSWLSFERDRLRLAWRDAALNHLSGVIDAASAMEISARLLEADPLDESALRAHMTWLTRAGHTARARQIYRGFVQRLADDLGLAPSAELQALHDSLGKTSRPSAHMMATAPDTVAVDFDFVGRTVELRRIATLLAQDDCRLLCVLGPGGVGKTRLAKRALSEIAPSFAEGAVFIALEDVRSSSELGGRLARDLGVTLSGNDEPLNQVIEYLRNRQMLLVLDNFEQIAADPSVLQRLIEACRRLKIVVTSRVRLSLPNEWLLPLEGLPYPEIEDQDNIETFDAVRLFVQAARRVEPDLMPSTDAASIIDICQTVEGLPLALQLAAAWTRVLSCDAIAAELRHGTELLHATDAAHPVRHASIENVFNHSWLLLSPLEREALARLSVFRGGFSPEAARTVAGASLPVLGALNDKSLLRKDGNRIFMHPLVQQLAALRLRESDAQATAEHAHAQYFHRLMAQLQRPVENGEREGLQHIDIEFHNCRIAWCWSIAHEAKELLAKSARTLFYFCDHRGRFNEGVSLLRDALYVSLNHADQNLEALLLSGAAHLEYRMDRYADAEATALRALTVAKTSADHSTQALCFQVLGACYLRTGRHADARRSFQQSMRHAVAGSDLRKAGVSVHNMGVVERAAGHRDEAQRLFMDAMSRHKAVGDHSGEALCLANLSLVLGEKGEIESAITHLKTALAMCERHGLVHTRALVLTNLTELVAKAGDHASAATYGRQALEIAQAIGNRNMLSWLKLQFVRSALAREDLDTARSELEASLTLALAIGRPSLLLAGILCFADVLAAQGQSACAHHVLTFASEHSSTNPSDREQIRARIAQLPRPESTDFEWPGFSMEELARFIVTESNAAYAPLIAALRSAPVH